MSQLTTFDWVVLTFVAQFLATFGLCWLLWEAR